MRVAMKVERQCLANSLMISTTTKVVAPSVVSTTTPARGAAPSNSSSHAENVRLKSYRRFLPTRRITRHGAHIAAIKNSTVLLRPIGRLRQSISAKSAGDV